MKPHLFLTFPEGVASESFEDFASVVSAKGLRFERQAIPFGGPCAGIELLLPAAFIVYIAKGYFDGFLNEMGKDHYQALKSGIGLLRDRLAPSKITMVTSNPGKIDPAQPFSLTYAVMAEANEGFTFKFLFRRSLPAELRDRELDSFLSLLAGLHAGALDEATIARLGRARVIGRTVLLAYDADNDRVAPVDPIEPSGPLGPGQAS